MTWRRFQQLPIRSKLLAMVLVPLLVVLPLLGVILLLWLNTAFDRLLTTKIRSDLAVAQGYFERVLGEVGASTSAVADSHELHAALAGLGPAHGPDKLAPLMRAFKQREGLDFINLRAPDGRLLVIDNPEAGAAAPTAAAAGTAAAAAGATPHTAPFRPTKRADGRAVASIEVLEPQTLGLLAPALLPRVAVPIVPTRNAVPSERVLEDRAMVVLSSAPVLDLERRVLAHVQAGVLLNRNLPFIDHINEIVYPQGSLPFGSRGTATLFLGDVRISTNVRLFSDDPANRAIGTRVSQTVHDEVLVRGNTWLDRAFVVSDWYVSGYLPLHDGQGTRVGMLYVGFLEQPFTLLKVGVLVAIGAIFFAVMIASAALSLRLARGIFAPLERMARTMQRVEAGEMSARVGHLESADEIGRLAGHLDRLLDSIDDKTRALQRWNAELDAKVVERTQDLEAAQQQLVRSEKLAAVGQLTASIAHEVNNPIAVIQGNLDLVRELLGADALRVRGELRLIDEQIERMRLIVTRLLQFARPGEFAGYVVNVDTSGLLDDCLVLVGHLLARTRIEVKRDERATLQPAINRQELQQVLVNLLVNAIHAMPEGGTLALATFDTDDGGVAIAVADTGPGLGPELTRELFKPFVTRKKDGTGLGLWISRSIVERYGGDIVAMDRDDGVQGALFTVRLRTEEPGRQKAGPGAPASA
jgi:two-component system, NtrC family, sensor kinase